MSSQAIMQKFITSPSFFIGKKAENLISFGSGQPDLKPPKEIYEVQLGNFQKAFQYGSIQGELPLREVISREYPHSKAHHFIITNGASEALDLALRHLHSEGKKTILIPRPYYYSYPYNALYVNMKILHYDLVDGHIELESFKKNLKKCDVVLINSPSNPAGSVQSIDTLKTIEEITQKKGIYVISDEVYKDLIYERKNYLIKGEKVITINSFSKTFGMCGMRVGYAYCCNQKVIDSLIEIKTHTSMNTSLLSQQVALAAMSLPKEYIQKTVVIWQERRNVIYEQMLKMGLELWKPEGAFYVFPKFENPQKVIRDLFYKHNLIAYDGKWFGCANRVRFSYALDIDKIKEGLRRLENLFTRRNTRMNYKIPLCIFLVLKIECFLQFETHL